MSILILVFYFAICILLSVIGYKKRIGWAWSLFFSIFLTPIVGGLLVILSPPKNYNVQPKDSSYNKICGWIFVIFSFFFVKELFFSRPKGYIIWGLDSSVLCLFLGSIGLSIYFFERTKRNNILYEKSINNIIDNITNPNEKKT